MLRVLPDPVEQPHQLPRGRHHLPREFVIDNQRERMLRAVIAAVAEQGYQGLAVDDIVNRSGVSRSTFYEHFENKEDCFLAAHDQLLAQLIGAFESAYRSGEGPVARLLRGTGALLERLAAEPEVARVALVEVAGASPLARERCRSAQCSLLACLEETIMEGAPPGTFSEQLGIAAIVGASADAAERVRAGKAGELAEHRGELVSLALAPFVGIEEAERAVAEAAGQLPAGSGPEAR
jgi:AcrR family transcriptional regulator